jgi:hypothetical protein
LSFSFSLSFFFSLSFSFSFSFSLSFSFSFSYSISSYRNGSSDPHGPGTNGLAARNGSAPDKPERKINAKEAISKHRNWFSNFEKNKSPAVAPGPESVDSARRTSVNKENKPSYTAAGPTVVTPAAGRPGGSHAPLSPSQRPARQAADSIESYMQNWRRPGELTPRPQLPRYSQPRYY